MNDKFLVIRSIYENKNITQRELAKNFGMSLGKINGVIKEAELDGYLIKDTNYSVTDNGKKYLENSKVDKVIIFACGMGIRLAPLTYDTPKSFIKIKGERMIERQIEQLHKAGIYDITIMVGYLKEKFDYLIDKYDVKLIYNKEYQTKNTISTFYLAKEEMRGKNVYVCVSDVYMIKNIYHKYECEPYYIGAFYEDCKNEWRYICNSRNEIKAVELGGTNDYCLVGPCFLTKEFLDEFIPMIEKYYAMSNTDNYYWEDVLVQNFKKLPTICVYKLEKNIIYEFDNLSDIKAFDEKCEEFGSEAITFVSKALGIKDNEIENIEIIKEGMTNHSYRFKNNGISYIARVPGEGTNKFINRNNEFEVYEKLRDKKITEEVIFFDKNNGYKISKFFENARTIDITKENELYDTMKLYKKFHGYNVKVSESCDILDKIDEYLGIIKKEKIAIPYEDFDEMLSKAEKLRRVVISAKRPKTLCHGDPNPGNVLYTVDGMKLIDFEYAGMADPISDIALFGIYVDFDIEKTLDLYRMYESEDEKENNARDEYIVASEITKCKERVRSKNEDLLVIYMALGGFYSALWAIVRAGVGGIDYGTYGMMNYRTFKKCYAYLSSRV